MSGDARSGRFLDLADFERAEILDLLALAQSLKDKPQRRALAGKVLGLLFMNPSLRTLASFQVAMAHLGGSSRSVWRLLPSAKARTASASQ